MTINLLALGPYLIIQLFYLELSGHIPIKTDNVSHKMVIWITFFYKSHEYTGININVVCYNIILVYKLQIMMNALLENINLIKYRLNHYEFCPHISYNCSHVLFQLPDFGKEE